MNEKQLKEMLNKEPIELLWNKIKDLQKRIDKAIGILECSNNMFAERALQILKECD